jgi:hypothetical protein
MRIVRIGAAVLLSFTLFAAPTPHDSRAADPPRSTWKKHVVNAQAVFEAADAADINGDGKLDIFSGDSWYEAPTWKRHQVRDVAVSPNPHYREDFASLPLDVNRDGKIDFLTCSYFTRMVGWVEHPGDPLQPWKTHSIDTPGPSEAAQLVDINGDGRPDFLPNTVNRVVWYELSAAPGAVQWIKHDLGAESGGHGVGIGDVNRDGRLDIITPKGWHEQPATASDQWPFHAEFQLGAAGILILGYDVDGDSLTDIVWGMGHAYGLYWLKQTPPGADGKRGWVRQVIDETFSQVHTLLLADLDGDGQNELITGKRVYAHEVEPGATDAPCILQFRYDRKSGRWQKAVIYSGEPAQKAPPDAKDRDAQKDFATGSVGTGLQLGVHDIDGDGDIDLVCPGKSGLYVLENLRAGQ